MKVKKENLLIGDIIKSEYKGREVFCKVLEILEEPLYNAITNAPVWPIIVDRFVSETGKRLDRIKLPEEKEEFDVVYRENPEPYDGFWGRFEKLKSNPD